MLLLAPAQGRMRCYIHFIPSVGILLQMGISEMSDRCFDGFAEKIDTSKASLASIVEHLYKDTNPCSEATDRNNTLDSIAVFNSLTPEKAKAVNDSFRDEHASSFLLVIAATPVLASSERMEVANKLGLKTEDAVRQQLNLEIPPLKN